MFANGAEHQQSQLFFGGVIQIIVLAGTLSREASSLPHVTVL